MKCICIKNLLTPFGSFKKDTEYFYKKESNYLNNAKTIYVYFKLSPLPNLPYQNFGLRFYVNETETFDDIDLLQFYDYFEDSRLTKLKKLNVL